MRTEPSGYRAERARSQGDRGGRRRAGARGCAGGGARGVPGLGPGRVACGINTPNDPDFDHCESDDEQGADCSNVFDEEYERFGFAPDASENTALYKNPLDTARQQEQNTKAGRNPLGQIPGVSADRAWKRSTGRPDVRIAILDTGIRWRETEPAAQGRAQPRRAARSRDGCAEYDCDGDGAFTVDDYADDPRVSPAAGNDEADDILDASDLIAVFSDGTDADANGYADDIAGWDFFDDDNDPYDASSYSLGLQPRHRPRAGGRAGDERGRRRHRRLPALPDRPDPRLGHVRDRHEPVRARRHATRPTTGSASSRRRSAG